MQGAEVVSIRQHQGVELVDLVVLAADAEGGLPGRAEALARFGELGVGRVFDQLSGLLEELAGEYEKALVVRFDFGF